MYVQETSLTSMQVEASVAPTPEAPKLQKV